MDPSELLAAIDGEVEAAYVAATPYLSMLEVLAKHESDVANGAAPQLTPDAIAEQRASVAESIGSVIDDGIGNVEGAAEQAIRRLRIMRDTDPDSDTPAYQSRRVAEALEAQMLASRPGADPMDYIAQGLAVVDDDPRTAGVLLAAVRQMESPSGASAAMQFTSRAGELRQRIEQARDATESHRAAAVEKIAEARRKFTDEKIALMRLKEQAFTLAGRAHDAAGASLALKMALWNKAQREGVAYVDPGPVPMAVTGRGITGTGLLDERIAAKADGRGAMTAGGHSPGSIPAEVLSAERVARKANRR